MKGLMSLLTAMAFGLAATPATAEPAKLLAAGSLQATLSEASQAFTATEVTEAVHDFAHSGLLRERIMEGETADVFASAKMKHRRTIAQPDLEVTSDSLDEQRPRPQSISDPRSIRGAKNRRPATGAT